MQAVYSTIQIKREPSVSIWITFTSLFILILVGCEDKTEASPTSFVINPKFKIELVTTEPLIKDPVDMEVDSEGAVYVLEWPGYSMRDQGS